MIDKDADEKEVEEAYRERVKETHPDQGGSPEEFQLVKSAYEEIKSEKINQRGQSKTRRQGSTQSEQTLRCSKCSSPIHNVSNATYRPKGDEILCPNCVVNTNCQICGKDLLLSIDKFSAVDGNPICKSCVKDRQTAESKTRRNNEASRSQTNTKQKTNSSHPIPVWTYLVIVALISFAAVWYYRPTFVVTLSPGTLDALKNGLEAVAGPVVFILVWALWRKK